MNYFRLFHNYEIHKADFQDPELANLSIIMTLLFFSILTLRKRTKRTFLDRTTTDQLRGLAILMVMLGHLWVHVAQNEIIWPLAGEGLTLFLILSGYGMTKSIMHRIPPLKEFAKKRIIRVMVPYWFCTFCILALDYLILDRTYPISHISFSLLGFNMYDILKGFDYVRWFVSYLLFWYVIIYISTHIRSSTIAAFFPFAVGLFFFPLDYFLLHTGWYQILAFPMGCLLARYSNIVVKLQERYGSHACRLAASGIFFLTVSYNIFGKNYLNDYLPSILVQWNSQTVSILMGLVIVFYFSLLKNYYSRFLHIFGRYSYELFLIHGVFLIKYNPIIWIGDIYWSYIFFLIFILVLAITVNCIIKKNILLNLYNTNLGSTT